MTHSSTSAAVSRRNKFSSGFKFISILLLVLLLSGKSFGQTPISITSLPWSQATSAPFTNSVTLPTCFTIYKKATLAQATTADAVVSTAPATNATGQSFVYYSATASQGSIGWIFASAFKPTSPQIVFSFTNNTGSTITSLAVSVDYRKLRQGTTTESYTLTGSSGTIPTSLNYAYTADGSVATMTYPGTAATNTGTITGLNITNGSTYTLTWTLSGANSSSHASGIGNIQLSIPAPSTYSVTYDSNSATSGTVPTDGTAYSASASVTVKTNSGTLARTGYAFAGWNTLANGTGTHYAASGSATFTINANTTLYAEWTPTYTVTYNANSATGGSVPTDNTAYSSGATVTVSGNTGALTRTGYAFVGWNTAANGTGTDYAATGSVTFAIAGNTTLYAKWTPTYTVSYNSNNATSGLVPTDGNSPYNASSTVTVLTNSGTLARTGYAFAGWNTAANGSGTDYAASGSATFTINANTTLYAKWTANNNTVTFDGNSSDGGSMSTQSIATAATASLTTVGYTKTGYSFAGWATSAGGAVVYANTALYTMGTGNVTLYAKWTANNNTITFNGNGSDGGSMSTQSIATDASASLTTNGYTKTGYTFSGWNTVSDGSGTAYSNGATYSMGTANVTLYAQWTVISTPTINLTGSLSAVSSTYGTASSATSFSVSGSALTADILVTPPSGFEVSQTSGGASGYASTQTLTQSGGAVSSTTIYVRLAATTIPASYTGNVVMTSAGATTQNVATVSSTVATKQLTISGLTINTTTKVYDGTTGASVSGTPSLLSSIASGTSVSSDGKPITGDEVNLAGSASAAYNSKDVATATTVSVTGLSLSGAQSAYYTLNQGSAAATITAKALTMSGLSVPASKTYDRLTTAVVTDAKTLQSSETSGTGAYDDGKPYTGDVVSITGTPVGTYNSKDVATATTVTFSGLSLTGATASNYSLTIQSPASATITAKGLTVTGASVTSKTYTGTNAATITGATLSGVIAPDAVTVSGGGTFADVNVANGISVTPSLSLGGADAGNYTLTQPTLSGNITTATLTITGVTGVSRPYNGGTTATVAGTPAYGGLQNGESFTVTGTPSANFADAAAANGKTLTVTGYTAPSSNYSVTQPSPKADITKVALTITAGNQSVPNGTAVATVTGAGTYTPTGFVNGESASVISGSISYTTNYTIATAAGTAGVTITPVVSSLIATNYSFTPADGTITVTVAPVTLGGWNFTAGTATPNSTATNLTVSDLSQGNNNGTTALLTTTSSSSTYSGYSASYNAGAAARTGALVTGASGSAYFEFTITPAATKYFSLTGISFGSRSTSTGPASFTLRSSVDSYATDVATGSMPGGTTWTLYSSSNLTSISGYASAITYRLYGYAGTGSSSANTANWRIDDLILTGYVLTTATPPGLSADASANTVDNNIDITFTDDATWRSKITAVKVGSTALTATTDYVITAGNIQLKPSGANSLLTASGSKSVTVVATGYSDTTPITQVINAGAPTSNSTATISSILAAGATRTITCTAKDQYNNLVSGYTFKYAATIANTIVTTNESYTIDGSAITTTATNSITATTNGSGIATFDATLPATIDATDGISLQVKLADGTTSIGSAFAYHELPSQTISFGTLSNPTYGDSPYTISATGGGSGNPVVFTSSNTAIATCSGTNGTTITVIAPGSCTIYANQAGNSSYNAAAQASQSLTVDKKALTITSAAATSKVYDGTATATITGTLSSRVGADVVSLTLSGTFADVNVADGISVTSTSSLSGTDASKYTLTQPAGLTANITQATQVITGFGTLYNRVIGASPITLSASVSSGLTVSYISSNEAVATVSGTTLTIVGVGTTTITASQAGDQNHSAATNVTRDLTVTSVPVAAWDFTGSGNYASLAATTFASNLVSLSNANLITRGAGAASNTAANSFRTQGFQDNGISTSNTDYFQVTLSPVSGKSLSLSTIDAIFAGTSSYYLSPGVTSQYAYSLNGTDFTLIGSPVTSTSLTPSQIDLSTVSALQDVLPGTTITLRYYASGQTTSGGWGFTSPSSGINGLAIGGTFNEYISTSTNASDLSDCPTCNVIVSNTGTLTIDASKTYNNLTIAGGGKVTLNDTKSLTLTGNFAINSHPTNGTGTFVDYNATGGLTVSGTKTVDQYLGTTRNWYLSTPLSAAVTPSGYTYFKYDEPGNNPHAVESYLTNETLYWEALSVGSSLAVGTGYVILPGSSPATLTFAGGTFNTGNKVVDLTRTTGKTKEGFNLIGNPYPSYVNAITAINAQSSKLESSIWYRTKVNSTFYFETVNTSSGFGTNNNGGGAVTGYIPPMQSFWVRVLANQSPATISFSNAMRTHESGTNRLKAPTTTAKNEVLRLQVSNGTTHDETVLYANSEATNGLDKFDSKKMTNASATIPEIYTLVDAEPLVINGLNAIPYDTELSLGFTTGQSNSFTIRATEMSNFEEGTQIILRDYLNQSSVVETDLTKGDYSFTSDAAGSATRFTLLFKSPAGSTGLNPLDNGSLWISTNANNQIQINGAPVGGTMAAVYNAIGQKLSEKNLTSSLSVLDMPLMPGVYMVTVSNAGRSITKKVVIK